MHNHINVFIISIILLYFYMRMPYSYNNLYFYLNEINEMYEHKKSLNYISNICIKISPNKHIIVLYDEKVNYVQELLKRNNHSI